MARSEKPLPPDVPVCGCAYPGTVDPGTCYCGAEDLLGVIRRRYSLAVLNVVRGVGSARFHDLETALPGASTSTLAHTLRALTEAHLLERSENPESVPRALYTITSSGCKLIDRLRPLLDEIRAE